MCIYIYGDVKCVYICKRIYVYVCIDKYMHVHTYARTYIHTHAHTEMYTSNIHMGISLYVPPYRMGPRAQVLTFFRVLLPGDLSQLRRPAAFGAPGPSVRGSRVCPCAHGLCILYMCINLSLLQELTKMGCELRLDRVVLQVILLLSSRTIDLKLSSRGLLCLLASGTAAFSRTSRPGLAPR